MFDNFLTDEEEICSSRDSFIMINSVKTISENMSNAVSSPWEANLDHLTRKYLY